MHIPTMHPHPTTFVNKFLKFLNFFENFENILGNIIEGSLFHQGPIKIIKLFQTLRSSKEIDNFRISSISKQK